MTAAKLQRLAAVLSNQTWTRHWLNFHDRHDDVQMAIQCRDFNGTPERIPDFEKMGFEELPDFIYTIKRTNDDGTAYVSQLF